MYLIKPEDEAWIALDKLIEAKDPNHYQAKYDLKFKTTCDGKGPMHCEGYIGCPCDCS